MAVKIRLKRIGRRHLAAYRVCVCDSRTPRDGRVIEEIGSYSPTDPKEEAQLAVKKDRAEYWLGVGAQPSETVRSLLKKAGVAIPVKQRKSKKGKKKAEASQ